RSRSARRSPRRGGTAPRRSRVPLAAPARCNDGRASAHSSSRSPAPRRRSCARTGRRCRAGSRAPRGCRPARGRLPAKRGTSSTSCTPTVHRASTEGSGSSICMPLKVPCEMDEERWVQLVERLESRAQADPKGYRRKVVRFAALGYAYIATALSVLLVLAVAVIYLGIHHPAPLLKLLLPIGALAV